MPSVNEIGPDLKLKREENTQWKHVLRQIKRETEGGVEREREKDREMSNRERGGGKGRRQTERKEREREK